MLKSTFTAPLLIAIFTMLGSFSAQAQLHFTTSTCGPGYGVIEVLNSTKCEYDITMNHQVNGNPTSATTIIGPGQVIFICYEPHTTVLQEVVLTVTGTTLDGTMTNPGYPGTSGVNITGGGCQGLDNAHWDNVVSNPTASGFTGIINILP